MLTVPTMIVCLCHRVTDSQIKRHVAAGCCSFDELQDQTRVATGCGCCREYALQVYEDALCCAGAARAGHRHPHADRGAVALAG